MPKEVFVPGEDQPHQDEWRQQRMGEIRQSLLDLGVQRKQNYPLTKQRKELLLFAIAAGATVQNACKIAEVNYQTVMKEKRRNPKFAQEWQDALDISVSELEQRMEYIFMNGPLDSMATVQAGKTLLAARSRAYNDKAPAKGASASVEGPNGGKITVHIGAPGPD